MTDHHYRNRYEHELALIHDDLLRLGDLVIDMVSSAAQSAAGHDDALAEKVIAQEVEVDQLHHTLMERVITTLALQGPVAKDLQKLTATFVMLSELEKVGDEATKLASRGQKLGTGFPSDMHDELEALCTLAVANLRSAIALYEDYSEDAAEVLIKRDDEVDRLYKVARNQVLELMRERPNDVRQLLRCAEIFHALEHVSDHTVDMAKQLRGCFQRYSRRGV